MGTCSHRTVIDGRHPAGLSRANRTPANRQVTKNAEMGNPGPQKEPSIQSLAEDPDTEAPSS